VDEEVRLKRRDGSLISCRLLAQAVHPQYGERDGIIWMAEDITERRQMDQDLARARDQAEAANRAKSTFLANTSHELRTPLNALLGLARLARDPGVDELRRRQYIEKISDSAETLSAIISDILDLSKIEAGKMHLDRLPFRLDGLLQNLHEAYGALADTKGLTMRLQRDSAVPDVVVGDPVRVRQILSNYLNNALKYTRTAAWCWRCMCCTARCCASRSSTPAPASTPRPSPACSPPSPRWTAPSTGATAAPAWACRSAASWPG
jgi:signal transduction histidine kinase